MSYRVGTTNYNLPLTEGTDKRDWSDTNQAFQAIDTALKTASDNAISAGSAASAAQSTANSAASAAAAAQTAAGNAQTAAGTAGELAQTAKNRADSAYTKASTVGDLSNLTTTDKSSAVAAINEVKSDLDGRTKYSCASFVRTPNNEGIVTLEFSDLGVNARPEVIIGTSQSFNGVISYAYEYSSTQIKLFLYTINAASGIVTPISGVASRFCLIWS
jgi:hypothetical protein